VIERDELLQLADTAGIGLLRVGRGGLISQANAAAHAFLGRPPGSLRRLSVMEAFLDHRVDDTVREAVRSGSTERELSYAGEPQQTLIIRARRESVGGGSWIVLHDVSELRRLQRIRTEFIDNLSHELRTPLTSIRLLAEVLVGEIERAKVPPRVREAILKIEVETGHLVQMVTELLDLSRIEQGEIGLRREAIDLGRLVASAMDRLRPYAAQQNVELRSQLPADDAERRIIGDEDRLGQLLMNLLHNAIKFSPAGGEVVVRARAEVSQTVLEVEDHGIGIPGGELERVFERFYKVDRARSPTGGGTGLGLSIARHIAERHGGHIWVESEEGRGSRFSVVLPRS
jgi:two-component system, OmpR family, phosphate regulon sensor histidine kinase PhoR